MAGARELTGILGAPVADRVAELPDETLGRLAGQIATARDRQSAMLDDAVGEALRGVPLPVRGIVRKALLG
jgi:hypothetical protein